MASAERILIVSSAPHARCGIAKYALQQAQQLRAQGHVVHWASTDGGTRDVEHPLNLPASKRDFGRLAVLSRGYDRVFVHYQHDLYFGIHFDPNQIAAKNLLLAAWFRSHGRVDVIAHEVPHAFLKREGGYGRKIWLTERTKWTGARSVIFHTAREQDQFLAALPQLRQRAVLKEHHTEMVRFRTISQEQARKELAIPLQSRAFLCIGFIQESKGFDRAIRAFQEVASPDARLYVVGSVRTDVDGNAARYLSYLRRLARQDPRVTIVEGFVDDATFDTWLTASDVVILPYRNIFSSGVAARARLFGRRIIAANVGGLADQLRTGDVLFETELELRDALCRMALHQPTTVRAVRRRGEGLRVAFVLPWYGRDIPGGAEQQARQTIIRLAAAGVQVEVLTTCIEHFYGNWSVNTRPVGVERVDGIPVHRFPVKPRDEGRFNAINEKICRKEPVTEEEIRTFETEMIKCDALVDHIRTHADRYDLFMFIPYMFATTIHGSAACPGKAVHIPCLHDEGYLDVPCYGRMLTEARGVCFNTRAEKDLAIRRFGLKPSQVALLGEGLVTDWWGDGEGFRARHQLTDYLLFVGRKIPEKQFPLLLEYFRRYRDERAPDLKLVLAGPGTYERFADDGDSILDLQFAPEQDKRDALAGSLALCLPSLLESFSLVVMESWIAGRPVLVDSNCDVTREHCENSGGGLHFGSYAEFAACVDRLRQDRALADRMGAAGRSYVLENYEWPLVIDRYLEALERWQRQILDGAESPADPLQKVV